jgi:hypothetical protein
LTITPCNPNPPSTEDLVKRANDVFGVPNPESFAFPQSPKKQPHDNPSQCKVDNDSKCKSWPAKRRGGYKKHDS